MPEPEATEVIMRHPTLAAALAAFQANRPTLAKTNDVDVIKEGRKLYSYKYADLADVEETVLPLLGAQGIAWYCHTEHNNGNLLLVCTLEHESGDMRSSAFPLLVKLTDPQGLGSYLTYFQRYALMMLTGVHAAGEDDDGQRTQVAARNQPQRDEEPRQARQERPSPGPGTRQGAAARYALDLLREPLERLPEIWTAVEAGGHQGDQPTPDAVKAIREYLAGAEIPADSLPGKLIDWSTGALAHIAGFRLLLSGWTAQQMGSAGGAALADKTYMALCQIQTNFGRLNVKPTQRLGDWLALNAAALHRAATPVTDATVPYGRMDETPDVSGYDGDDADDSPPWDTSANSGGSDQPDDHDRPAVLEGT